MAGPAFADQQPVLLGTGPLSGGGDKLFPAFTKLNANDAELYARIASLQAQIATLQGISGRLAALNNGFIDGVVIGGTTPAAGSFTSANVSGALTVLGGITGSLTGNASTASKLASASTLTLSGDAGCSFTFDGSASTGCSLTLASTGATPGSYGSGTAVPVVTFNAKGLATATSSAPITFPVTSVAGRTGAVTLSPSDFGPIASGTILANPTGAAAVPTASTLSAILDNGVGSSRATIAVRGASAWVGYTPVTSGCTFQFNGTDTVCAAASPGTGAVRYDTSQGLTSGQQSQARSNIAGAGSGANSDITSLSGLTTALSIAQGGTGAATASTARTALGAAESGANSSITSLTGLTTALPITEGGTGSTTAGTARSALGAAASGANSDITSISGLTTPLSVAQGGTGSTTGITLPPLGQVRLSYSSATALLVKPYNGNQITINGSNQTVPSAGVSCPSTGLTAASLNYAYLYMSGATMTCEVVTTTHATNTTTGVEQKSGDATRTLVGMAYVATAATFVDNATSRTVASWFNRQDRAMNTTAGTYTTTNTSNTAVTELSTGQRLAFVSWGDEDPDTQVFGYMFPSGLSTIGVGFLLDGTQSTTYINQAASNNTQLSALFRINPAVAEGYHYVTPGGFVGSGTGTFNIQTSGRVRS